MGVYVRGFYHPESSCQPVSQAISPVLLLPSSSSLHPPPSCLPLPVLWLAIQSIEDRQNRADDWEASRSTLAQLGNSGGKTKWGWRDRNGNDYLNRLPWKRGVQVQKVKKTVIKCCHHDKNINRTFLHNFWNGARGHKICTFLPKGAIFEKESKKSYLIVLSGCSFLCLINFFSLYKREKIDALFLDLSYFNCKIWARSARKKTKHIFEISKLNLIKICL